MLKRLRPIARLRDVEVTFESIRPVTAEIDEVKITQVFTNLVENAIKYNKEHGWVKVLLDADHQFFTVEISDSGIGIPEADYDHIFERFYRVDKSHSREIGGTGLGLAITKCHPSSPRFGEGSQYGGRRHQLYRKDPAYLCKMTWFSAAFLEGIIVQEK